MKKFLSFTILSALALLFVSQAASAQLLTNSNNLESMANQTAQVANLGKVDIGILAASIIKTILGLLGIVFLALIIMAGFKWMTAGGNEEQIKKSRETITNAVIGLIIVLAAYAITYFIFNALPFSGGSGPQGVTGG
ncbi:MAG: hypothetical protein WC146_00815 [Patescibacteria group bacterium]|jgi:hypothetical protein